MSAVRYERGGDGVVLLTLVGAGSADGGTTSSIVEAVERLVAEKDHVTSVVVTGDGASFSLDQDRHDLLAGDPPDADELVRRAASDRAALRRLETSGVPVVAAIDGDAVGPALDLALACHHRVLVDDPGLTVGFPDVTFGLLPGAGGIVRSVRMLGVQTALSRLLLQGQRLSPAAALDLGLVDQLVASRDELLPAAKAWIAAQDADFAGQAWDQRGYRIPGGTPADPALGSRLAGLAGGLRQQLKGANYPAPHRILAAAVEGAQVDVDTALGIEGRYLAELAHGPVAENMVRAYSSDLRRVRGDRGGATGTTPAPVAKAIVLGAGMMGAAIAYVCAAAGIEVVLKDVSQDAADRGRAYSEKLVAKGVQRGTMSQDAADALLGRILATDKAEDAQDADLVIEAVFEDPAIKAQVFAEIEPFLKPDALLGSNTSTLPITELAEGVSRPADFIGLHFFSPVDKMPLLEIIKGERTSGEALARALALAAQIGKTPIVVNDSRGFFTSRVINVFILEAITMLGEGVPAPSIEQASGQAGYPAPVLQLTDELNLELLWRIRAAAKAATEQAGGTWNDHPAYAVIERMLELGRPARVHGAGFYEYVDGKRTGLWPGLRETFPPVGDVERIVLEDLTERMLFAEALETIKCVDEGVIESFADANVGSILGIGFPGWTGGVLQYVNGYAGGVAGFAARAQDLAARYGERFTPPPSLLERAATNRQYRDQPTNRG